MTYAFMYLYARGMMLCMSDNAVNKSQIIRFSTVW
jgi:hypothetical protein